MFGPQIGAIHSEFSCSLAPTMPVTPPALQPSPYHPSLVITAALPAADSAVFLTAAATAAAAASMVASLDLACASLPCRCCMVLLWCKT
eukprot:1161225-Pelagomonas_calceolata.AAC.25